MWKRQDSPIMRRGRRESNTSTTQHPSHLDELNGDLARVHIRDSISSKRSLNDLRGRDERGGTICCRMLVVCVADILMLRFRKFVGCGGYAKTLAEVGERGMM